MTSQTPETAAPDSITTDQIILSRDPHLAAYRDGDVLYLQREGADIPIPADVAEDVSDVLSFLADRAPANGVDVGFKEGVETRDTNADIEPMRMDPYPTGEDEDSDTCPECGAELLNHLGGGASCPDCAFVRE